MEFALDALLRRKTPESEVEAVACVDDLADELKKRYGQFLVSAASKFLWMRFQAPVVIYDSLGRKWLTRERLLTANAGYWEFCKAWRIAYQGYSKEIESACVELGTDKRLRQFTLAGEAIKLGKLTDIELEVLIREPWFRERVFDNAVINNPLI